MTTEILDKTAPPPAPQAAPPTSPPAPQKFAHTEVRSRINQYTSGYWALAIPALMARYVARYTLALFGIDEKNNGVVENGRKQGSRLKLFYAGAVGTWMTLITSIYAVQTVRDMKRIFADTLAAEFDKKPEDVTYRDVFRSHNSIVKNTRHNFYLRNALRGGISMSFFARFLPFDAVKQDGADSVDLGTGLTGAYLTSDVLLRKETFFEKLQVLMDQKINHKDRLGDYITDMDVMNLLDRHRRDNVPGYVVPRMDSPQWSHDLKLSARMADLLNQTYGNIPNRENAGFTIPKLIYLFGEGLIDPARTEQSVAYVEVASRYGLGAVKQIALDMQRGKDLASALQPFPLPALSFGTAQPEEQAPQTNFASRFAPSQAQPYSRPAPAAAHGDKIAQQRETQALSAAIAG